MSLSSPDLLYVDLANCPEPQETSIRLSAEPSKPINIRPLRLEDEEPLLPAESLVPSPMSLAPPPQIQRESFERTRL